MRIDSLPFHIGSTALADNPSGLPNTYPFELVYDVNLGVLVQPRDTALEAILREAYEVGQSFGTPLAADQYGRPYAEDFLSFIERMPVSSGRALEIGAGVGYLTRLLLDRGWDTTSLEPGRGYEPHWSQYGVSMLQEFFPTPRAPGPFDLICSYGVLEHVPDPSSFLRAIKSHLAPQGVAVLSVPDCGEEISVGDPTILCHEHVNYFEIGSLTRLIESVGMSAFVVRSGFGRCLYAVGSVGGQSVLQPDSGLAVDVLATYPERCSDFIRQARNKIVALASEGSLGVYCAARGLTLLDPKSEMRFFDDDSALHGKFLPPFRSPIASREDLFAAPVNNLVVMSRTFGSRIRESLLRQGYEGKIILLEELVA
jgi:SAM-dependent methyltransferase